MLRSAMLAGLLAGGAAERGAVRWPAPVRLRVEGLEHFRRRLDADQR